MRRRILQIVGEEATTVEDNGVLLILRDQMRLGGSDEKILAVDLVSALGEEADV